MQNIRKSTIALSLIVGVSTILSAHPNIDNSEAKTHVEYTEKATPKQKEILLSYANTKHEKMKHPIEELVELPHPVKYVLMNKELLKISDKQMDRIEKEMLAVYPPMIHGNMDKAKAIEDSIRKGALDGKTKESLKKEIDSLVKIKVQITNDHIDALNKLKDILSDEQYKKLLTLIKH